MKIPLTPEQEAQLARIAARSGLTVGDLVCKAVNRYVAEDLQLRTSIQAGVDAADRGDFLTGKQVWAMVERNLKD